MIETTDGQESQVTSAEGKSQFSTLIYNAMGARLVYGDVPMNVAVRLFARSVRTIQDVSVHGANGQ